MEVKKVDLTTINSGAAVELFEEEFNKVLRNIADISVNSDAAREINLKFKIKPNRDRNSAVTTIQASSKLITTAEHESSIFLSGKSGMEAFVTDQNQMQMSFENKDQQ